MTQLYATIRMSFRNLLAFRVDFIWMFVGLPLRVLVVWILWDFLLQDQSSYSSIPADSIFAFVIFNVFLQYSYGELDNAAIMESDLVTGKAVSEMTLPIAYHRLKFYELIPAQMIITGLGVSVLMVISSWGLFSPQLTWLGVASLILSLLLALVMNYFIMSILAALAIHFGWISKMKWTFIQLFQFLGGLYIPLQIFPGAPILQYLNPVAGMYDLPASIFIGILSLPKLMLRLGVALVWVIIMSRVHVFLWRSGLERFTAPGG